MSAWVNVLSIAGVVINVPAPVPGDGAYAAALSDRFQTDQALGGPLTAPLSDASQAPSAGQAISITVPAAFAATMTGNLRVTPLAWTYPVSQTKPSVLQASSYPPGSAVPAIGTPITCNPIPIGTTVFYTCCGYAAAAISGANSGPIAQWMVEVETEAYDCAPNYPNLTSRTLGNLRAELAVRLGYSSSTTLPATTVTLLNSFLIGAQKSLFDRYQSLQQEMFFTWALVPGVRFYSLTANLEGANFVIDPRKLRWVGVEHAGVWYRLQRGIMPELYTFRAQAFPARYEIRSQIEIWPEPKDSLGFLRVRAKAALWPFAADTDHTSIDDEFVFLWALANAKANASHPDAAIYQQQAMLRLREQIAGAHMTARYVPGQRESLIDPDPVFLPLQAP